MSSSLTFSTNIYPNALATQATNNITHDELAVSIESLPQELLLNIFGFLSPKELGRISPVCREWKMLASDDLLWNAFEKKLSSLKVIDAKVWETHVDLAKLGIKTEDDSPVNMRSEIAMLTELSSVEIEGDAGFTVLTMPEGLTFNKLMTLARNPKLGNATDFRYIWFRITDELGDTPVQKTYKVAISNSVLKGSRNLSVSEQQKLVNKYGCEMPGVLPAATLSILTYISSKELPPTRLYNHNPRTYTRCCEQIDGWQLVVGGIAPSGLNVGNDDDDCESVGVGGLRMFKAIGT